MMQGDVLLAMQIASSVSDGLGCALNCVDMTVRAHSPSKVGAEQPDTGVQIPPDLIGSRVACSHHSVNKCFGCARVHLPETVDVDPPRPAMHKML